MIDPSTADRRTCLLIDDLRTKPAETSWLEFKHNNAAPELIGKLISALSNAARLAGEDFAYLLWGIQDSNHAPVGTTFEPSATLAQKEPLEFWLAKRLSPSVAFEFKAVDYEGARLVLLIIPAANTAPVEFDRTAYIRIGSATPRLSDYPERQSALWSKLQPFVWESGIAEQFLSGDEVLSRLDYAGYFDLTKQPLPDSRAGIFDKLLGDRLIQRDVGDHWSITHLGALLFAKKIGDFDSALARKAVRFVAYDGISRADQVIHRHDGQRGYAVGFQGLVDYIDGLLPRNEHIGKAFRTEHPLFPSLAIRELVANALIHQDMTISGAGPLIEMFRDRLEISNPGQPLVKPDRFLDLPPRSRNERLAALMRRMGLCEEQGTGIDKVLTAVELHQMPAPDFRVEAETVKVVLYAPRRFAEMTSEERVRACYQHAALKYVSGERMKNASLCERLGIDTKNASQASVVIRHAQEAGLIRAADPERPRAGYVPWWA